MPTHKQVDIYTMMEARFHIDTHSWVERSRQVWWTQYGGTEIKENRNWAVSVDTLWNPLNWGEETPKPTILDSVYFPQSKYES